MMLGNMPCLTLARTVTASVLPPGVSLNGCMFRLRRVRRDA